MFLKYHLHILQAHVGVDLLSGTNLPNMARKPGWKIGRMRCREGEKMWRDIDEGKKTNTRTDKYAKEAIEVWI